jgi:nucleotide-binding universal stress UspA family protein
MNSQSPFNSLLVPTDFSEASREAFEWALRSIDGNESVIIVLHVIEEALIDTVAQHEFAPREDVARRMRTHAGQQLHEYKKSPGTEASGAKIDVDTIVAEGLPFLEIIRKADDFAVDAIVMGKIGTRGHVEKLLFGSTAEKVLRGARRPVIVLPEPDRS